MRSHRGEVTMILLICWLVAAGEYSLTVIIGMGAISTAPQALADLGARQYPAAHVAAGVFSMMWFSLSVVLLVWLGNLASSGRSGPRFRVG